MITHRLYPSVKKGVHLFVFEIGRAGAWLVGGAVVLEWSIPGSVLPFFPLLPAIILVACIHLLVSPPKRADAPSAFSWTRWLWMLVAIGVIAALFLLTYDTGTLSQLLVALTAVIVVVMVWTIVYADSE